MSMRVSGGEENAAKSPGVADQKACKPSLAREPFPGMPVPEETIQYYPTSPLLGLLACKELMPQVLEHERALLVMKEHDYASQPYRPEILQLSYTVQPTSEEGNRGGEAATATAELEGGEEECFGANRTLLNCRNDLLKLRASVSASSSCEPVATSHFREVVGLQVALLREQQEQLYHKDSELNVMRKEKEQVGKVGLGDKKKPKTLKPRHCTVVTTIFEVLGVALNCAAAWKSFGVLLTILLTQGKCMNS